MWKNTVMCLKWANHTFLNICKNKPWSRKFWNVHIMFVNVLENRLHRVFVQDRTKYYYKLFLMSACRVLKCQQNVCVTTHRLFEWVSFYSQMSSNNKIWASFILQIKMILQSWSVKNVRSLLESSMNNTKKNTLTSEDFYVTFIPTETEINTLVNFRSSFKHFPVVF